MTGLQYDFQTEMMNEFAMMMEKLRITHVQCVNRLDLVDVECRQTRYWAVVDGILYRILSGQ